MECGGEEQESGDGNRHVIKKFVNWRSPRLFALVYASLAFFVDRNIFADSKVQHNPDFCPYKLLLISESQARPCKATNLFGPAFKNPKLKR